jgi:hypothetical protein
VAYPSHPGVSVAGDTEQHISRRHCRAIRCRRQPRPAAGGGRTTDRRTGSREYDDEEVAEAAGAGKGTLFRDFSDRNGLLLALLDEVEAEFQEACTSDPSAGTRSTCGRSMGGVRLRPVRAHRRRGRTGAALGRQVLYARRSASDRGRASHSHVSSDGSWALDEAAAYSAQSACNHRGNHITLRS